MMTPNKLHLGCGGIYLDGWINIDFNIPEVNEGKLKVDRVYDLSKPLDYEENTILEIWAMHLFEHLPRVGLEDVVNSWYKCLIPGGRLVMEMPNFNELIKLYAASTEMKQLNRTIMEWIFGNQEHKGQFHHWGWSRSSVLEFLKDIGFRTIVIKDPESRVDLPEVCFRVEALK